MLLSGAEIIIECLKEQGVDTIFGYPGGTNIAVYDALYKHSDELRHILTAHEQGAAHAADGYARATGRVGVCLVTSGPGATNLVTGVATAYMDSVPMVAITVNVAVSSLGKDSFQEVDIAGITMPVTKHNFIVRDITHLADTIRRAFAIARRGRKGPVLVDITKDVTQFKMEYVPSGISELDKRCPELDQIDTEGIAAALKLLKKAKKPVLLLGGGAAAADAGAAVKAFLEYYEAPVVDTLMGKGTYPGDEAGYMGMLGMHGTKEANYCIAECDLLIALGTRFSERITARPETFAGKAKIIQIDIDPAELNKNIVISCGIIGDVTGTLAIITKGLGRRLKHTDWMKETATVKSRYRSHELESETTGYLKGIDVIHKLCEMTKGKAIIATEVGQNQMWTAQGYVFTAPRQLLTSGGLGTMGYGLGAAIGAAFGCPDKIIINVAGDGCFRMNMNELATAAAYRLPVIEILMNNHSLGMVRQWQTLFYGGRHAETSLPDNIDYIRLADAMGVHACRVTDIPTFEEALKDALGRQCTALIECDIDTDDMVWPMVIPGTSLETTYTEEEYRS